MGPQCTRFWPDGAKSQTTSSAAMKYSRVADRDGAARASSRSAVRPPRVPRNADVVSPAGRIDILLECHHPVEGGGGQCRSTPGRIPPLGRPCRLLLRHAVERAEPEHQVAGVDADHAPPGEELGEALERLPVARVV